MCHLVFPAGNPPLGFGDQARHARCKVMISRQCFKLPDPGPHVGTGETEESMSLSAPGHDARPRRKVLVGLDREIDCTLDVGGSELVIDHDVFAFFLVVFLAASPTGGFRIPSA